MPYLLLFFRLVVRWKVSNAVSGISFRLLLLLLDPDDRRMVEEPIVDGIPAAATPAPDGDVGEVNRLDPWIREVQLLVPVVWK